jgi:hypothetical protein
MAKARSTRIRRSRNKRPSEKAYFHQVSGAGRSRVKRQFFGLSDREQDTIGEFIGRRLDANLGR